MSTQISKILDNYVEKNDVANQIKTRINESIEFDGTDIIDFMIEYVEFNSVFAGCVSSLAGRIHLAHKCSINKLRGNDKVFSEVGHVAAKHVFEAAIDEYNKGTHKSMSRFTLNEVLKFYHYNSYKPNPELDKVLNFVYTGYGFNETPEFGIIAENLGFHIGSEKLASFEFDFLYKKIKEDLPELYQHLKSAKSEDGYDGMLWIKIHGIVEEDHCQEAIKAAEAIYDALDTGEKRQDFLDGIERGLINFHVVQNMFFEMLAK